MNAEVLVQELEGRPMHPRLKLEEHVPARTEPKAAAECRYAVHPACVEREDAEGTVVVGKAQPHDCMLKRCFAKARSIPLHRRSPTRKKFGDQTVVVLAHRPGLEVAAIGLWAFVAPSP